MSDSDAPVRDTLAAMTAASIENSDLPAREHMIARIAALIAVDAPAASDSVGHGGLAAPAQLSGSPNTRPKNSHVLYPHTSRAVMPRVLIPSRLATAGQRGRCAGNDTTCWKVGRFCQGMLGWPTIPSDRKPMAS